jgi:5-methylcytosine-specific restriction endonuclease McrA
VKKGRSGSLEWTDGRKKGFITSLIRAGFRRWPPKYECLNAAKTGKKVNKATGRMAEHYKCNACKKHFVAKDVQVDHVDPVVCPKKGFVDWNTFIDRLLCTIDNLQVLCTGCHKKKTEKERKERKK